jgi:hypothetical protein
MRVALATASSGTPRSSRARFSVFAKALISTKRQLQAEMRSARRASRTRSYIITAVLWNMW